MGKENRERGRERRRRGAPRLSVVPETPPAELQPPVYDLFPISLATADMALGAYTVSSENPLQAIADNVVAESPLFAEHDEPSANSMDVYAIRMWNTVGVPRKAIVFGILAGHMILRQEASVRGGVLPILTEADRTAASKAEMGGEDAQASIDRLLEIAKPIPGSTFQEVLARKPQDADAEEILRLRTDLNAHAIRVLRERMEAFPSEEPELARVLEETGLVRTNIWTHPERHRDPFSIGFLGLYHRYKVAGDIRNLDSDFRK